MSLIEGKDATVVESVIEIMSEKDEIKIEVMVLKIPCDFSKHKYQISPRS